MTPDRPYRPLTGLDYCLLVVLLVGLYLAFDIRLTPRIPLPSPPAGIAAVFLLCRRRDQIEPNHIMALFLIFVVYLTSTLFAPNLAFLGKRTTGLIQFVYSLVLAYGLFLTLVAADARALSRMLFAFCIAILLGALLEDYSDGFRALSDAARLHIYSYGIYDADRRDILLYGRIRPKLFTSEPSSLTFIFTLLSFTWLMVSFWRGKILWYLAMMAAGLLSMPGPTLLLMAVLLLLYLFFARFRSGLANDRLLRFVSIGVVGTIVLAVLVVVGSSLFAKRLALIDNGEDGSFYFREIAPVEAAGDVVRRYPVFGIGLTGEPLIADRLEELYQSAPSYSADLDFGLGSWEATHNLTNYFWLHWIYLGFIWGSLAILALGLWLRVLGTPSAAFCFLVWSVMGQSVGDYVGPRTWAVMAMAAAGMILQRRTVEAPQLEHHFRILLLQRRSRAVEPSFSS
jgi:hypothetical protein